MRSPVYRNLDRPFQILGFNSAELTVLCIFLVGGGELAGFIGLHRIWALVFTVVTGCLLIWVRRSLGDYFVPRLIRFLELPKEIYSKLIFRFIVE
ncbi:MAG: hypothetical protein IPL83_02620 [Bdellovibrionales bacterium]|jgi:hypothetical protein|nr:hypothetical protein [Bdellovibrionales bacterium]